MLSPSKFEWFDRKCDPTAPDFPPISHAFSAAVIGKGPHRRPERDRAAGRESEDDRQTATLMQIVLLTDKTNPSFLGPTLTVLTLISFQIYCITHSLHSVDCIGLKF